MKEKQWNYAIIILWFDYNSSQNSKLSFDLLFKFLYFFYYRSQTFIPLFFFLAAPTNIYYYYIRDWKWKRELRRIYDGKSFLFYFFYEYFQLLGSRFGFLLCCLRWIQFNWISYGFLLFCVLFFYLILFKQFFLIIAVFFIK